MLADADLIVHHFDQLKDLNSALDLYSGTLMNQYRSCSCRVPFRKGSDRSMTPRLQDVSLAGQPSSCIILRSHFVLVRPVL